MSKSPVGDMCNGSEMMKAFDAPPRPDKDVVAAGRVAAAPKCAPEPGTPRKGAAGPGPANG